MTVKQLIQRIEIAMGPAPHGYLMQLINDGLKEISGEMKKLRKSQKADLIEDQRWYAISEDMIDIDTVYIKDDKGDYTKVPRIMNPEELIVEDEI